MDPELDDALDAFLVSGELAATLLASLSHDLKTPLTVNLPGKGCAFTVDVPRAAVPASTTS